MGTIEFSSSYSLDSLHLIWPCFISFVAILFYHINTCQLRQQLFMLGILGPETSLPVRSESNYSGNYKHYIYNLVAELPFLDKVYYRRPGSKTCNRGLRLMSQKISDGC